MLMYIRGYLGASVCEKYIDRWYEQNIINNTGVLHMQQRICLSQEKNLGQEFA